MTLEEHHRTLKERKHRDIVNAAQDVFLTKGYDKAQMTDIAKLADVSTATLYNHFPSKQELFGAVMGALWEDMSLNINEEKLKTLDARAGLIKIGTKYAELLCMNHMRPMFRVIIAEAPHKPELGHELYLKGKKPYLDRLEKYLKTKTQEGVLNVKRPDIATRQFLGMINDVVFWPKFLVVDLEVTDKEIKTIIKEAVETFLARYEVKT